MVSNEHKKKPDLPWDMKSGTRTRKTKTGKETCLLMVMSEKEVEESDIPVAIAGRRGRATTAALGVVTKRTRRSAAVVAFVARSLVC